MAGLTPDLAAMLAANLGGGELAAYGGVGGALLLLFRIIVKTLDAKDKGLLLDNDRLRAERDRAHLWAEYQRAVADHWQAIALGAPNPPPLPVVPPPVPPPPPLQLPAAKDG
jgi:hypothetical protein